MLRRWLASIAVNSAGARDGAVLLARGAVLFFLAVLPFSHNAALKNLALAGMLAAALWLGSQRRLLVDRQSPILQALAGLLAVLVVTAALGTDPLNSFDELRKHFLPGILLLLLIPSVFQGEALIRLVLSVIALAFMLRTGLTLSELGQYFPDLDAGRASGSFIKGYSLDAGFYIPVLIALLLLGGRWRWLAGLGLAGVLVAMLLLQSRTPLLAIVIAIVPMFLVLRQWRTLLACLAAALLLGGFVVIKHADLAERLASTFRAQTYLAAFDTANFSKTEGLAARVPIWFGVVEITADRPWKGYGFGWKKLGSIALDGGYVARWAEKKNGAFAAEQVAVFSQPPSTVNPHNLYLQVYFESGLFGLVAYLVMLLILFASALRLAWRSAGVNRLVGALVLAYLVDHVVLGLGNGLWIGLGPSLALVALLELVRRSGKTS